MIKPTNGIITSDFGFRIHPIKRTVDFHPGIDYGHVTTSDPVYAINIGKVRYINNDVDGYGKYIVVEHDGYCSLYAHLKTILVSNNQEVRAGEKIAIKGTTGSSTGIHLHFEIRDCPYAFFWDRLPNGEWKFAIDPEKFFLQSNKEIEIDLSDVDNYAKKDWEVLVKAGVLDGTDPKKPLLRQDFAVAIRRIILIGNNDHI